MSINSSRLIALLESTGYEVYQDEAAKNQDYPYIVYSFVSEDDKRASSKIFKTLPYYQVSLFTEGGREDINRIKEIFNKERVPFKPFKPLRYKENNKQITNFYTYVRCLENGQK